MNDEMSLEEQIRCMQEMRDYLESFCKIMGDVMESMDGVIGFLKSTGFSVETEETYRHNYYRPACDTVEDVINNIHTRHFDYIDRVIENLERAKNQQ